MVLRGYARMHGYSLERPRTWPRRFIHRGPRISALRRREVRTTRRNFDVQTLAELGSGHAQRLFFFTVISKPPKSKCLRKVLGGAKLADASEGDHLHFLVDNVQQLDRIGQRLISPGVFSIFFVFFLRFPILIFPCALPSARRGTPVPPERSRPRTMQSPWHLCRGKEVREPRAAYRSEKARSLPSAYDADRALILA